MALVAWNPQGYLAPLALTAVTLPAGRVTENDWWDALANRVTAMAIEAGPEETLRACKVLGTPETLDPRQAGQYLVGSNLNLRTNLDCAILEGMPFPTTARNDPEAKEAIEETDLEMWTELARAMVSASSLD